MASTSTGRSTGRDFSMAESNIIPRFEPSAATASMFVYAQGPNIFCASHDMLALERRFSRHSVDVHLLAVDNQSEHGGGRLIVSYDVGKNAIIWDLMTGEEVARFASYEPLTVAVWMKNGNIAFGNTHGSIILFEPETSQHVSARTLDQIRITALAPASDCRTFAIGYQNGSLLVATLQPRFTILHKLTTNRTPSPVISLAWHNSAPRQKADMLATQMLDGDLRVWSVSKSTSASDPARVVRILKRAESHLEGPHWMGWSKNGRIIQYSDGQTISWDVRTKYVTSDAIPTIGGVRGLALYGPSATLFTLGPASSVQQFDLNAPSVMVANVTHHVTNLPPSPPVSVEERIGKSGVSGRSRGTVHASEIDILSSDEDGAHAGRREMTESSSEAYHRYDTSSPLSSQGSDLSGPRARNPSALSHQQSDITYISSMISPSVAGQMQAPPTRDPDPYSGSISSRSSASKPHHRPRNEPERTGSTWVGGGQHAASNITHDIFKFTRARLSDLSYRLPYEPQNGRLTNHDLRRQMLRTIFGWQGEVEELIRDEMSRHPAGLSCRILLSKWLGNEEPDLSNPELLSSSDWMLLALTGVGSQNPQQKLARAYLQRLLASEGDVHTAATIMIALSEYNDAIEIYISHRKYMEALILTCLRFPAVWERQAAIVKKWGEYAVQHGEQQLAIRCFACTDRESSEPWASPSAMQLNFASMSEAMPEAATSPALTPILQQLGPQRDVARSAALKLVTTFSNSATKIKFFGNEQTPIAAGITPIFDSALSPNRGTNSAFLRPSPKSQFNTPATARLADRLPPIGENGLNSRSRTRHAGQMPSTSTVQAAEPEDGADGSAKLRLPSPNPSVMMKMQEPRSAMRSRSRDQTPVTLKLQVQDHIELTSPGTNRFHWPSRRRGASVAGSVPGSVTGSVAGSVGSTARSHWNSRSVAKPDTSGEEYVSDKAPSKKPESQENGLIDANESLVRSRGRSEDRGRPAERGRGQNAKSSPVSPVSMSPQDLRKLSNSDRPTDEVPELSKSEAEAGMRMRSMSRSGGTGGRASSRVGVGAGFDKGDHREMETTTPVAAESQAPIRKQFEGSEDEREYQLAMDAQSKWRIDRSCSRARAEAKGPRTPKTAGLQQRSSSRGPVELPGQSKAGTSSSEPIGDVRWIRDDRDLKRQNALTELEERRKMLLEAEPGPVSRQVVESKEVERTMADGPKSTGARSMYGKRNKTPVGLPATPKAMRLVLNPEIVNAPKVPVIPLTVLQKTAISTDNLPGIPPTERRPSTTAPEESLLTLLPSTVYQAPARMDRSSSAPVPDSMVVSQMGLAPLVSRFGSASPSMRHMGLQAQEQVQMQMQAQVAARERRPSRGEREAPVVLKELQHLAAGRSQQHRVPPAPPPAHSFRSDLVLGGSAQVEIVHDDDGEDLPRGRLTPASYQALFQQQQQEQQQAQQQPQQQPQPRTLTKNMPRGHSRASGSIGGSISSKLIKASSRMRSRSRTGRAETADIRMVEPAPYESVQLPLRAKDFMRDTMASPGASSVASTQGYSTGLTKGELV